LITKSGILQGSRLLTCISQTFQNSSYHLTFKFYFMSKKIIVAITGGIAAYKAVEVISGLIAKGNQVKVITTDTALHYVTEHVLSVMSKDQYETETPGETKHIELAKWADAMIVVPATANTIAKLAYGMADNFVTTTFLSLHKETYKFICPAMNTHMWENPITQDNINKLTQIKSYGYKPSIIINPSVGMLACGDYGAGKLPSPREIVETITDILEDLPIWSFPFPDKRKILGPTSDSYSFLDFDWKVDTDIPIDSHVGAFGTRRRHDVHKGVDLYCKEGELVIAVEKGKIVDICPFTGEIAGFPWWENTHAVYVEGKSGIVVYGEIIPNPNIKIGDEIKEGSHIGNVTRVLKKDNGRPREMLHMELHEHGYIHTGQWEIGKPKPTGVLNPAKYLLKSIQK
jgi:3-polyprenyl-4-hydroxybenzoate decarboxylase